jgi:hypothetical protein
MIAAIVLSMLLQVVQENPVDRAGRMAALFWDQFPAVKSTERIVQAKLEADGEVVLSHTAEFDYLAFLNKQSGELYINESRIAKSRQDSDPESELLLTSGFPSLMLLFHPDFRDRFDFEDPGAGQTAGQMKDGLVVVKFRSRPNAHSMSALKLKDRMYPILWQGEAWIDAETGAVARIQAALSAPMTELGLSGLEVDMEYAPAVLSEVSAWLPKRAVISLQTERQQWRNVHEFSAYQKFSVTTSSQQSAPR